MNDPKKAMAPLQQRLFAEIASRPADGDEIGFHHSTLCQVGLPHKNPGDLAVWERKQGDAYLYIQPLFVRNPLTGEHEKRGLPYGEKARLMLMHFNANAIQNQSPVVEIADSMTAFVRELVGRKPNRKDIEPVRDQVARLSSALISLSEATDGEHTVQQDAKIISKFELWYPSDPGQRVLWTSRIQLSTEYFDDLMRHGVPLDMRAVRALAKTSLGLDLYTWLAQRLHRIPVGKPVFVPWGGPNGLWTQFGHGYGRLRDFKTFLRRILGQVKAAYPDARFELDDRGMKLYHSPPPVLKRATTKPRPALS
jgi:hypothetical protein